MKASLECRPERRSKTPLKPRDIRAIRFYRDEHRRLRDRAPFDLAIDSRRRGCDLAKIRIGDLMSAGAFRDRATVIRQKTGRPVQFEIMAEARTSLKVWLDRRGGDDPRLHIPRLDRLSRSLSTWQYARLVDEWVSTIGLDKREHGTHPMRRTKVALICKATGNLGRCRFSWPIPTSKIRSGISASMWTMP